MRRFIPTTLLALILLASFPLLPRERVHAQFGIEAAAQLAIDTAEEVIKKRFFDMIVDQIVIWIQGGGKPLFVQDWRAFLAQYGNVVTGDIVMELGLGAVCSPFGFQLQLAVMQPPRFSSQISCSLDKIVGNMVLFYNNFRTGGFIAYNEAWQPRNNFYGALILAMDEKETKINDRRFAAMQEAQAGMGFLGTKKCDASGHCFITTPGTTIGAAAAKVVGADIDYLVNAETFASYVAAISDALINRLIREGVGGLQGVIAKSAPPIGYVPKQQPNSQPCGGLAGEALAACRASIGAQAGNVALVRTSYIAQVAATLTPLTAAQDDLLAMQSSQQIFVARLSELNTCQIGRNTAGKEATTAELTAEQAILADLLQALVNLQLTTVPLVNVKTNLTNATTIEISVLMDTMNPAYPLLDEAKSTAYKTAIRAKREVLDAKITSRSPEIQTLLTRCISS